MSFSSGSVSGNAFTGAPGSGGDVNGAGTGASVVGVGGIFPGMSGFGSGAAGAGPGVGVGVGVGMGGAGAGAGAGPLDGLTQEQIQAMQMTKFVCYFSIPSFLPLLGYTPLRENSL